MATPSKVMTVRLLTITLASALIAALIPLAPLPARAEMFRRHQQHLTGSFPVELDDLAVRSAVPARSRDGGTDARHVPWSP